MSMVKGSMGLFTKTATTTTSGGFDSSAKLLNSFMWNDRDCNAKNHFICERPIDGLLQSIIDEEEEANQGMTMGQKSHGK